MASQTRQSASEDERRQKVRTLTIATISSATAAVVISQFSVAGTWIAAALTPVLVTLISEALHKPTTVIASRMTTDRPAVITERAPADPQSGEEPPVRVYRSSGRGARSTPRVRRRVAIGAIAATAAIAFGITAVALTGTELITGGSIGKGSSRTTLWGGSRSDTKTEDKQTTTPAQQNTDQQQQQTAPDQQQQQKQQTTTQPQQTTPQQTTPSTTVPALPPTTTP